MMKMVKLRFITLSAFNLGKLDNLDELDNLADLCSNAIGHYWERSAAINCSKSPNLLSNAESVIAQFRHFHHGNVVMVYR